MGRILIFFISLALMLSGAMSGGAGITGEAIVKDIDPFGAVSEAGLTGGESVGAGFEGEFDGVGPALNNGGEFVKLGGSTYYRRYNRDCFEETGLWDMLYPMPNTLSAVCRLNPDGKSETVFVDDGAGKIFVVNPAGGDGPRFVMYRLVFEDVDESGGYSPRSEYQIYSVDPHGNNKRELGEGFISCVDEARGLIVAWSGGRFVKIDEKTGERVVLQSDAEPFYYDPDEAVLYFQSHDPDEGVLEIFAVNVLSGSAEIAARVPDSELPGVFTYDSFNERYEVHSSHLEKGWLSIYLAAYGGTGNFYDGSALLCVKTIAVGGANKYSGDYYTEPNPREQDWFDVRVPFERSIDGPFQIDVDWSDYYMYNTELYSDETKAELVLSVDDVTQLGYKNTGNFGEDGFESVINVEYVDGEIWFTAVSGRRAPDVDIGWRYGYTRDSYAVYMKDLATGKIKTLYGY